MDEHDTGDDLIVTIRKFREGGFGLLVGSDVVKAATSLDEILGFVNRAAHIKLGVQPHTMAQRFRPQPVQPLPPQPEPQSDDRPGIMGRLKAMGR